MRHFVRDIILPSVMLFVFFTLLLGVAYPAVSTTLAMFIFPNQANGSLVTQGGKVAGSALIGQAFADTKYFWGRPSATTPAYNGKASAASNLGAANPELEKLVKARIVALKAADPKNTLPVPVDLVTASASGLDPHISVAAAEYQLKRVARVRHLDEAKLRELVGASTEGRQLGFLGEPRVNVLKLNLALDEVK